MHDVLIVTVSGTEKPYFRTFFHLLLLMIRAHSTIYTNPKIYVHIVHIHKPKNICSHRTIYTNPKRC